MPRTKAEKSVPRVNEVGIKAYLDPNDVNRLEKAANNLRDRLLIRLLFHIGCSISEALAIVVEDFDLRKGTVVIQHLKIRLKLSCPQCGTKLSKSHRYCPGCGARVDNIVAEEKEHRRVRTLPIDDDTLRMLKGYVSRGGPVVRDGKRLLFGINRHRAWQIVKECAEKARLPQLVNPETGKVRGISPHRLRDAFATHAVKINDSGDGLRLLQEQLGHASFDTTARYRKIAGEELRDWYQKLWHNEEKTKHDGI
jgi:integrase/recombinase XerD